MSAFFFFFFQTEGEKRHRNGLRLGGNVSESHEVQSVLLLRGQAM